MRESLAQEAARLTSEPLCTCGKRKNPGKAFCNPCYFKLPNGMRAKLSSGSAVDYATAFDECREWLKDN